MSDIFKYTGTPIFLDGAMGTMLTARGLLAGERPDTVCVTRPELLRDIHSLYAAAGSDVAYTNTFGANERKLAGTGFEPEEIIEAAVHLAREEGSPLVALDVGPIGELMEPVGSLSFDDAYRIFARVMRAGEKAGVDYIACETFTDLAEARAAVLAAKENTSLPVAVTMSFESTGRTFTGCTPAAFARTMEGIGADAVGLNCSLGPSEIYPMARELCENTELPIIIKPNAGLPRPDGSYSLSPEEFAEQMKPFAELGIYIVGGCCGTTDAFIHELRRTYPSDIKRRVVRRVPALTTAMRTVVIDGVRVIGERINPTGKKRFKQALLENDLDYILSQAIEQADAGADILDVNVGLPEIDEPDLMERTVRGIISVCSLPLQIDSSDPVAIERGLRAFPGIACVNSVNGESEKLASILPLVKKYGACVVGLTLDENGIPPTAEARLKIARRILDAALEYGIPRENVFIDCLTLTVSAQQEQAAETLGALALVKRELGLKTVLGVSNISFGLPDRAAINRTFLAAAFARGLDMPIMNPNISDMMRTVLAYRVLAGEDAACGAYIAALADAEETTMATKAAAPDIFYAIEHGMKKEARELTRGLLNKMSALEIVDTLLIPALDRVGERFERGTLFLPQLIGAAGASQEAFEVIRESVAATGEQGVSKGKIVLATVKGDIHDIGKNIVKVILENYGFTVYDLGRDVAPERVVEEVKARGARLVGLSALMTTTLPAMERTIELVHAECAGVCVMVGGAVLTPEYAMTIGADWYARDAKRSADIAREFYSEECSK